MGDTTYLTKSGVLHTYHKKKTQTTQEPIKRLTPDEMSKLSVQQLRDYFDRVTEEVKKKIFEHLGEKKTSAGIDSDLRAVNYDNYSNPKLKRQEFHWNCQRCVSAFELRRRGYDVEAQAFDGTFPNIARIFNLSTGDSDNYVAPSSNLSGYRAWNNKWTKYTFGRGAKNAAQTIVDAMTRWGEGSRAALYISWSGTSSSHIINVENVGGTITLLDSQVNKKISGQANIERYMKGTVANQSWLGRVDHADISFDDISANDLMKSVKRKGNK